MNLAAEQATTWADVAIWGIGVLAFVAVVYILVRWD